jgi:hypothetical protein
MTVLPLPRVWTELITRSCTPCCRVEIGQRHVLDITFESILIPFREVDSALDLVRVVAIGGLFVDPNYDVMPLRRLCQLVKAVQRVDKCLAARDHRMHLNSPPLLVKVIECVTFQQIVPQRQECRRTIANHERSAVLAQEPLHKGIERALVDPFVFVPEV